MADGETHRGHQNNLAPHNPSKNIVEDAWKSSSTALSSIALHRFALKFTVTQNAKIERRAFLVDQCRKRYHRHGTLKAHRDLDFARHSLTKARTIPPVLRNGRFEVVEPQPDHAIEHDTIAESEDDDMFAVNAAFLRLSAAVRRTQLELDAVLGTGIDSVHSELDDAGLLADPTALLARLDTVASNVLKVERIRGSQSG
ncbi:hypothetical protein C8F04DRAFT_1272616 [Mycena alexandri]|uniref:Uncharacterized protein n=1 Tax=Mycena alexandri TaxID=1745969 RepID=A0AAD6S7E9_9AGAR|nr:hypothetical protein C8F04DRAFT_1272616 [Mycena alexandri]